MQAPQAPAAPDPAATAAAQTASNKQTATTQYELGATNQVAPQGTSTYQQIGTWDDGTPKFQQTTALSPDQQKLYDTGVQTQQNIGDIGVSQSAKIGQLLDTPFNTDTATSDKIQGLQNEFLDPQWQRQQDALTTQLTNQGIQPGSTAYTNAQKDFSNQRQSAYDQSYLDSYNTGQQAALTQRNQPINEISALLSGSQVSMPNFSGVNTPSPGVAPTDVIGATGQSLAQQNVGYQANVATNQGINSGLFSLGSAALGAGGTALGGWAKSDARLKENIKQIGTAKNGLPLYLFNFKGDARPQIGLMAQDVIDIRPDAVTIMLDGYMAVHYGRALEAA